MENLTPRAGFWGLESETWFVRLGVSCRIWTTTGPNEAQQPGAPCYPAQDCQKPAETLIKLNHFCKIFFWFQTCFCFQTLSERNESNLCCFRMYSSDLLRHPNRTARLVTWLISLRSLEVLPLSQIYIAVARQGFTSVELLFKRYWKWMRKELFRIVYL